MAQVDNFYAPCAVKQEGFHVFACKCYYPERSITGTVSQPVDFDKNISGKNLYQAVSILHPQF